MRRRGNKRERTETYADRWLLVQVRIHELMIVSGPMLPYGYTWLVCLFYSGADPTARAPHRLGRLGSRHPTQHNCLRVADFDVTLQSPILIYTIYHQMHAALNLNRPI